MKPLKWRTLLLAGLTLWSIYASTPTILYFMQPKEVRNDPEHFKKILPNWLPQSHVKLGIDLQGGVQLVLGVNTADALENKLSQNAVDITRWAEDNKINVKNALVEKNSGKLTVTLADGEDSGVFNEKLRKEYPLLEKVDRQGQVLVYTYGPKEIVRIKQSALEQAERVVRSRVDQWGVSEPIINRRFDGSILVQLPGFRDTEQAKQLLGRTAQLRFQIVDEKFEGFKDIDDKTLPPHILATNNNSCGNQKAYQGEDREALTTFLKAKVPADRQLLFNREIIGDTKQQAKYRWTSCVLEAAVLMTGTDIQDAMLAQGNSLDRKPVVSLRLTGPGGRRFGDVTGKNINRYLAIVLDDVVESAPVIQQKITQGQAVINLGGSRSYNEIVEEGTQLAMILKSGAIPATITVLEQRQVGASLGPELANQGIKGALAGLLFVLLFMVVYYRRPGLIACIALILNGVYLLAVMAGFGFTLTLPGIAGFILTLGMAVDANVLINERIKQELREGKHPKRAIESGFDRVFWTIIDGHVTTLLAAFVLLETNPSGPIRGFSITLIIGLLISLFTSLNCTRYFFDVAQTYIPDRKLKGWLNSLEITSNHPNYNFLSFSPAATLGSILLAVIILGFTFTKGLNLGVDFAGGTEAIVAFTHEVEADAIREIAEQSHVQGFSMQSIGEGKKQYLIKFEEATKHESHEAGSLSREDASAAASSMFMDFKNNLLTKLGSSEPKFESVEFVGPEVGKELRTQGILSVIYAILAVLLYIGLRFDMRFGPGAALKLIFDVLILLGFYVLFRAPFDLVAVAAILTVVGYAVNDTIVIYDRIRENLILHPKKTMRDIINASLNETLSRSLNTSLVTATSLLGILIFASGQIWYFAMAMTLGIAIATFTSTFIASASVLWFEQWRASAAAKKLNTKA